MGKDRIIHNCGPCCDEMQHHENCSRNDKRKHHKLTSIRYIGVVFDPNKIVSCEKEVNDALSKGYEPIRDVETACGLVIVLGLWKSGD